MLTCSIRKRKRRMNGRQDWFTSWRLVVATVYLLNRVWLCNPMDCNPLGSSVHRTSQARILERVAISSSRGSSRPRSKTSSPVLAGIFFTSELPANPNPNSMARSSQFILYNEKRRFWRLSFWNMRRSYLDFRKWNFISLLLKILQGLPWWLSGKESSCQFIRHRFSPSSRKILHAMKQLRPWATAIEPVL